MRGIESVKRWFADFSDCYIIIGGTACDILFGEFALPFRPTKDIDMVLVAESITPEFGSHFWRYIKTMGYVHREMASGKPQAYRFTSPTNPEAPAMIELFSRYAEGIMLPPDAVVTPIPLDDPLSDLSGILLDTPYYDFLVSGRRDVDGAIVLDVPYIIPFKAKAWLNLTAERALEDKRREKGEKINNGVRKENILKHPHDILGLAGLLGGDVRLDLPFAIRADMEAFLNLIAEDPKYGKAYAEVGPLLREVYLSRELQPV